jgi:hypothetical protein
MTVTKLQRKLKGSVVFVRERQVAAFVGFVNCTEGPGRRKVWYEMAGERFNELTRKGMERWTGNGLITEGTERD